MSKLLVVAFSVTVIGCTTEDGIWIDDPAIAPEIAAFEHHDPTTLDNGVQFPNPTGAAATVSTTGSIDLTNEFFQDLGTNGRRCVSCHSPAAGWSVIPSQLQSLFDSTYGGVRPDPSGAGAIFRTLDGANSPDADVSTLSKRRQAYSMLLNRGVIRIGLPVPATAEFELAAVDDPYDYASAAELSLFRRPLPTTNTRFLSTVMWDGRETQPGIAIHIDLLQQASDATQIHAKGAALTSAQRDSIVDMMTALHTAQVFDKNAMDLTAAGAHGGPDALTKQRFYIGINDNFGDSQTGKAFTPFVFNLYDAWASAPRTSGTNTYRRSVARGQALFNTHAIAIVGVSGINDEAAFGTPVTLTGTCTTCHDAPNVGNHSVVAPLNIGLTDASRRTPDMPLYTLRNKVTGELKQTTDPGRAMISGLWKHIGRFKGPILRGLAARAPYFHNGFAADLAAVVDFYDGRFAMHLSSQDKSDLVAFLQTL